MAMKFRVYTKEQHFSQGDNYTLIDESKLEEMVSSMYNKSPDVFCILPYYTNEEERQKGHRRLAEAKFKKYD